MDFSAGKIEKTLAQYEGPSRLWGGKVSFASFRPVIVQLGELACRELGQLGVFGRSFSLDGAILEGMTLARGSSCTDFAVVAAEVGRVWFLSQRHGVVYCPEDANEEFLTRPEWKRRKLSPALWKTPKWWDEESASWPTVDGEPCDYLGRVGWSTGADVSCLGENALDVLVFCHGTGNSMTLRGVVERPVQRGKW